MRASTSTPRKSKFSTDSTLLELPELKETDSAKKSKKSNEDNQQASARVLHEELKRYKCLYQATRSNERIIQDKISKAVRESEVKKDATFSKVSEGKNKELRAVREELEAVQKKFAEAQKEAVDKSIEDETKALAALATKDESIRDLSRAKLGLQQTVANVEAELKKKYAEVTTLDRNLEPQSNWFDDRTCPQ
jgi:hypothetical protein